MAPLLAVFGGIVRQPRPRGGAAARWPISRAGGPRPARVARAVTVIPAGLALISCGWPSEQPRFGGPGPVMSISSTWPADGAALGGPVEHVDLCFDRRLDPSSVDRFDALLSSGPLVFDATVEVQLEPWRGPGGAPPGELPWCAGSVLTITPSSPLDEPVLYRLRLRPTPVGWGGEALVTEGPGWLPDEAGEPRFFLEFTPAPGASGTGGSGGGTSDGSSGGGTSGGSPGGSSGDGTAPAEGPPLSDLFLPGRIFDPARDLCGCHQEGSPTAEDTARARLDLTDPARAHDGLLANPTPRATGAPMVVPGDPSGSFLAHKVVRDVDGAPLFGVPGGAMPLVTPLPYPDWVDLAAWIDGGALP